MSKFNYKQFKVGDFVEVKRVVERHPNGEETRPITGWRIPDGNKQVMDGKYTRLGVIAGVKHMALGRSEYEEDCGITFYRTGTVTVWRVRFGLAGKEWVALPEDLIPTDAPENFPISSNTWSEGDKRNLSDCMKGEPRDNKGRWV